jgi:hypothetical protein
MKSGDAHVTPFMEIATQIGLTIVPSKAHIHECEPPVLQVVAAGVGG